MPCLPGDSNHYPTTTICACGCEPTALPSPTTFLLPKCLLRAYLPDTHLLPLPPPHWLGFACYLPCHAMALTMHCVPVTCASGLGEHRVALLTILFPISSCVCIFVSEKQKLLSSVPSGFVSDSPVHATYRQISLPMLTSGVLFCHALLASHVPLFPAYLFPNTTGSAVPYHHPLPTMEKEANVFNKHPHVPCAFPHSFYPFVWHAFPTRFAVGGFFLCLGHYLLP